MATSMSITDKIAHFLRLAEDDGATQDERDLAAAQAERFMLKHGIDRATAEAADSNVQRDEPIVTEGIFFGGLYANERMHAAFAVIRALKLQAYKSSGYGQDGNNSHSDRFVAGWTLKVVGFQSDVTDGLNLVRSLDVQAAVAVKAWAKTQTKSGAWYWHSAADKTVARRSFLQAFGQGAALRIVEARRVVVQEAGNGAALVLVTRERKVAEHFAGIGLGKARGGRKRYDTAGHNAGKAAGYNANTGGKALGNTRALSR